MAELVSKIIEVQSRLKAPKGQWNAFSKFNYRSAEDILEALKPLLAEVGLLQTISDEVVLIGDRYYIRATVTVKHEDEELCVTAYAREAESKKGMDESQITGSASSYARKYALNGMWCIDDTKDADSNEYSEQSSKVSQKKAKPKQTPKPKEDSPYLSRDQIVKMQTHVANLLGRDDGVSAWNSMLKHFEVTNDTLLSKDQSLYENFLVKWDSNVDNVLDWIDENGD